MKHRTFPPSCWLPGRKLQAVREAGRICDAGSSELRQFEVSISGQESVWGTSGKLSGRGGAACVSQAGFVGFVGHVRIAALCTDQPANLRYGFVEFLALFSGMQASRKQWSTMTAEPFHRICILQSQP